MDLIPSFQIDHTNLKPGIYISRQDYISCPSSEGQEMHVITTYDIRMTSPNNEPALGQGAIHTLEHLIATYLRNDEEWKGRIVYWGPMGCLTGNYLIMKGEYPCEVLRELMIRAFQFVVDFEGDVPGTTPATCGNCLLHDLPMAKWEAKRYVDRLRNDFCSEYPKM